MDLAYAYQCAMHPLIRSSSYSIHTVLSLLASFGSNLQHSCRSHEHGMAEYTYKMHTLQEGKRQCTAAVHSLQPLGT